MTVQREHLDQETMTRIWAEYVYEDKVDQRIQPAILEGWKKCKIAGVDPNEDGSGTRVDDAIFQSILEENKVLLEVAGPIMQSVFEVMKQSRFTLVLTDSVGYILELIGNEDAVSVNQQFNYVKGCLWDTISVGANAIGLALDNDSVIQMSGPEHYCRSHHNGACTAAPIHDPDGKIIGCLNLSGPRAIEHPHTLGLVLVAVQGIEGKLVLRKTTELMRASLEDSRDCIILLNKDLNPIWANSEAKKWFLVSEEELIQMDFRQVLPDLDWEAAFWRQNGRYSSNDVRVTAKDKTWHCGAEIYPLMDLGETVLNVTLKPQHHLIATVNKLSRNRAVYTFDDVFAEDPGMKRVLSLAEKYAKYDGTILIEGENGTGKELLAQAIHNASKRSGGPFVSVNCSSVPRDMLESSLFGYEAGTLQDASEEGNPGWFELANHGTLFLDEITGLPMEFQRKLVRAIETGRIMRIGGKEEIELDIRTIVSTSHNLEADVANQTFSLELFYRINILRLSVPPLRERKQDVICCTRRFIERLNALHPETPHCCSQEFLDGLLRYAWPGNVRELQNSIERTFYSSSERILGEDSLCFVYGGSLERPRDPALEEDAKESGRIRATLAICDGDVEETAERLGMSRATLYRRFKKYGIKPQKVKRMFAEKETE